jgi:hypothetical protein
MSRADDHHVAPLADNSDVDARLKALCTSIADSHSKERNEEMQAALGHVADRTQVEAKSLNVSPAASKPKPQPGANVENLRAWLESEQKCLTIAVTIKEDAARTVMATTISSLSALMRTC